MVGAYWHHTFARHLAKQICTHVWGGVINGYMGREIRMSFQSRSRDFPRNGNRPGVHAGLRWATTPLSTPFALSIPFTGFSAQW